MNDRSIIKEANSVQSILKNSGRQAVNFLHFYLAELKESVDVSGNKDADSYSVERSCQIIGGWGGS